MREMNDKRFRDEGTARQTSTIGKKIMTRSERYPYLTAWLGFVAFFALSSLLLTGVFAALPSVIFLLTYFFAGFFIFRWLVHYHLLRDAGKVQFEVKPNLSQKYPFLTAWLGFYVIHWLPTIFIDFLAEMFTNSAVSILVNLGLWTIANFFIFKFVIRKHIEPVYSPQFEPNTQGR